MQLASGVSSFLARVLEGYRGHPLFSPFLNVSREDPPQYFLHQCEVLAMLSVRRPVRVLIADEIGLGKTVTAIAVAKHLQSMGRARRVLVVVPRVLVYQWRKELERMGISTPRLLDRNTIDRYTSGFPEGFYLVSMDFLKRSNRISVVQKADWDLVIVDEAHRLGYGTQRFREIGKVIRDPHRDVLFLSATPHRGDPTDYIERLRLLDPHLVDWENLDNKDFYRYTHGSLVFRRTKEDINEIYEGRRVFTDARFYAVLIDATREEQDFVRDLVDFLRVKLGEWTAGDRLGKNALPLLAVLLFKRATSSPYAAMTTLQRLLLRRSGVDESALKRLVASVKSFLGVGYDDVDYEGDAEDVFDRFLEYVSPLLTSRDLEILKNLKERAASIMKSGDSKLNALVSLLESVMQEGDTKVVVFTEYRDTLQYLYNELRARHPEWVILTLSSAEAGDRNKFERIKRGFEKDLRARILLATDVVAEGVNLQVANVLINYEIPWSLVKLEQRIGRVWRLGQKRDVEVYNLFMANVADRAALEHLYRKLLNLQKAAVRPRPITGQQVLYYASKMEVENIPVYVKPRGKKFVKVTEDALIRTYLKRGEDALEALVQKILEARQQMEKTAKEVLYKPKSRKDVERILKQFGFSDHLEVFESFKSLLKAVAPIYGYQRVEENGEVKLQKEVGKMPTPIRTIEDFFTNLVGDRAGGGCLVAYGDKEKKISIIPIRVKTGDVVLFTDVVGVDLSSGELYRGRSLLQLLAHTMSNLVGISVAEIEACGHEADVMSQVREGVLELLHPLSEYRRRLGELRKPDGWIKDVEIELDAPVGCIHYVRRETQPAEPPEALKKEVEEAAIEYVMEFERREGRQPIRKDKEESYDILSRDPKTGEMRYIEVKGHYGLEISAELTENEAKLAKERGDSYWLYIVYNIGSTPQLLRFQNPLETMNVQIIEKVERRYILRPM